jgi:hypothetical protein
LTVTKTKKRGPKIASQLSLPIIPTAFYLIATWFCSIAAWFCLIST